VVALLDSRATTNARSEHDHRHGISPRLTCRGWAAATTDLEGFMYCSLKTAAMAAGVIIASATTALASADGASTRFRATSELATSSAVRGYPAVGGSAILSGPLFQQPGGQGAQVDHITTTGHPAPNTFTSRATDIHYLAHGTQRFKFTSTETLGTDGSLKIVGSGPLTGGTGAYRGARGRFSFICTAPSVMGTITCHTKGTFKALR
jgi:hypothetical protein